jgi:hypothetical protein
MQTKIQKNFKKLPPARTIEASGDLHWAVTSVVNGIAGTILTYRLPRETEEEALLRYVLNSHVLEDDGSEPW